MSARRPEPVRIDGRVAAVTGAGRGLGRAYAIALAAAGARVVVNERDPGGGDEVVAAIRAAGGEAVAHAGSVGETEAAAGLVACAVDAFGRLDIMCANAGILRDRVLWRMTDDDFDEVIRTHLRGTFTCARAAAIRMREQDEGGRLILVSSPAGLRGNFGQTNYAAAKAGIVAFARTWALELARARITVNAIVPTAWTAMTATIPAYAPLVDRVARGEPLPRQVRQEHAVGMAEDCAPLVVFLASEGAATVSGQCVALGGDRLALWSHPEEVVMRMREGGWSAEQISEVWPAEFAPSLQPYGIVFAELDEG